MTSSKILHIKNALDKFEDNALNLALIVEKDLKKYFSSMLDAIEKEDLQSALISAHSCKSICSLIDAQDAFELVYEMERMAEAGDLKTYQELYKDFSSEYEELNSGIQSYRSSHN